MSETHTEPTPSAPREFGNDINLRAVGLVAAVFFIFLFSVVVGVQALVRHVYWLEYQSKVVSQSNWELDDTLSKQQANIQTTRWVDKSQERVAIPIDLAMDRLVEQGSISIK